MIDRTELDDNFEAAVLYYIDQSGNHTRYFNFSDEVGYWAWDNNSHKYQYTWNLSSPSSAPDISTLMSYTAAEVQAFYDWAYVKPVQILNTQAYTQLASTSGIETVSLENAIIVNTTTHKFQMCISGVWTDM